MAPKAISPRPFGARRSSPARRDRDDARSQMSASTIRQRPISRQFAGALMPAPP